MRKLVYFGLAFALACVLCVYLLSGPWWMLIVGLLLSAGLFLTLRFPKYLSRLPKKQQSRIKLAALGLSVGFLWCGLYHLILLRPVFNALQPTQELRAEALTYPVPTRFGCSVDAEAPIGGRMVRLRLYLPKESMSLAPGDAISGSARFSISPDREDEDDLYQRSRGCLLTARMTHPDCRTGNRQQLRFLPLRCANRIRQALEELLPEDCLGYLTALTTGDKSRMSYGLKNDLSVAGVSHTVAISGMHVSVLIGLFALLLGKRSRLTALLGIPLVLFFVFFTGASYSVIRAAVMLILFLLAPVFRRESDTGTSLTLSLLLTLLCNPYAVANTGLQLSYGAVCGLTLLTGPVYRWFLSGALVTSLTGDPGPDASPKERAEAKKKLQKQPLRRWLGRLIRGILAAVSATLGALCLTLPLIYLSFGRLNLYGVLINLLVLPVTTVCFVGGIFTGILAVLLPGAAAVAAPILCVPVRYVLLVCRWAAGLPFASIPACFSATAFLICLYLWVVFFWFNGGRKPLAALAGLCCLLGIFLGALRLEHRVSRFTIAALDVGQGQCLVLRTPQRTVLVDCGGSYPEQAGTRAAEYLGLDLRYRADSLILTHFDADHAGGVTELMDHIRLDTIYYPDVEDDGGIRAAIERRAEQVGTRLVPVTEDLLLELDAAEIRVFAPVSGRNDNASGLSVLFSGEKYDMLITGDMDIAAEEALLRTHALPDVDCFVAGHHGAADSSGTALLERIRPETVLISVGENRYGHPTQEALDRLSATGADLYRTDQCGTIQIRR